MKKNRIVRCVFIFAVFFAAAHSSAGAAEETKPSKAFSLEDILAWPVDTVFNLGSIRVSGSRLKTEHSEGSLMDSPESVTVVDEEGIRSSSSDSLPEILSRSEGVTYNDDFGGGQDARVDLRGFGGEAKQALVLFDGVRAVEPFDNSMTWHLYPSEYLKQAEIRRGGASTVYGEGALSGVISLETKDPTKDWHVATENSLGSFYSDKNFVEASGTAAGIGLYIGARYLTTEGYRQNADHESASALLKTEAALSEFIHLKNAFYYARNDTGIPGPLTAAEVERDRRQKDPDGQFGDKFEDELIQDSLLMTLYAEPIGIEFSDLLGYRRRSQGSRQSFGGSFPGESINGIGTESFSNVVQAAGTVKIGPLEAESSAGVEWSIDDMHNPFTFNDFTFGPFSSDRSIDRRFMGYFDQAKLTFWERLIFETGARYDDIDWDIYDLRQASLQKTKNANHWSPKASLEYKIADALSVFGGISESFKVPDSNTLIFETPNIFKPNPNVDPSVARHREIGLRYAHPVLGSLRAVYFNIETKKEILFNDISNTNENFDTKRQGLELGGEWDLSEKLRFFSTYTYTEAQFDHGAFDGKDIPLVPRSVVSGGFLWKPDPHWSLGMQASGVMDQFALNDFNNLFPAENYWSLDGRVSYRFKNIEVFAKAQNLTGESYSSFTTSNGVDTVNYNPAPRQTVEAGFRMEI